MKEIRGDFISLLRHRYSCDEIPSALPDARGSSEHMVGGHHLE